MLSRVLQQPHLERIITPTLWIISAFNFYLKKTLKYQIENSETSTLVIPRQNYKLKF